MSSFYHAIHFRCTAIAVLAFIFLSAMKVWAQNDVTFPLVIDSVKSNPIPNGYHYEMWKQPAGTVKMTVYNQDATFDVEWSNIQNFVARVGLKYDETKTHKEIGVFTAEVEFQKGQIRNGLAYFGIYGWTVEPLVEYYVMEDWQDWRPRAGDGMHTLVGTINVDGSDYEVITRQMKQQPSVKGTQDFPQVFSIRKNTRASGTISISNHFNKWEDMGIDLGKLYEVKIKVESYSGNNNGSGSCKVTKGKILVDGIPTSIQPICDDFSAKRQNFTGLNSTNGTYTLISLSGQKISSIASDLSQPPVFSKNNVSPGIYLLQSKLNGVTLQTRQWVVK
ncbi:MAG: glycoside hydrolase family 11 protein [Fibrobacter sp.]|nr:glycoside hydrolase family 11 protein [Fibrobacter sp.]